MTAAELMACPGWPASMDRPAAVLYLGGSPAFFEMLEDEELIKPFYKGRPALYTKTDLDTALLALKARTDPKR